ncbi:MAG: glutamine-hydrolyzing carbamoyl-phosphate synthase small subunit [Pseudonocardiaceae bacterium]
MAMLVLEDGTVMRGERYGAVGQALGEAVFATGMTGYQETLTDPSYHRQIVVQTAPHIGNTGWNDEDDESHRIWVAGYVVRDPARVPSNWRSVRSLGEELTRQNVVGISGLDTRALTRRLREHGSMRAGIFSGAALATPAHLLARVRASPPMTGADLLGEVTTTHPYIIPATRIQRAQRGYLGGNSPAEPAECGAAERRFRVVALDLGMKFSTLWMLAARGVETHVLPATVTLEQILEREPDGVFLSNGPGDPATADHAVALTRAVLAARLPLFGICFGNQILGRALGRGTYKMRYGHRGLNVPVIEHATGRVVITSQNHGFAVEGEPGERFDSDFGPAVVTHSCPNDNTVEGLTCLDALAFSVQYHPESAAGPHDAAYLFDQFCDLMSRQNRDSAPHGGRVRVENSDSAPNGARGVS